MKPDFTMELPGEVCNRVRGDLLVLPAVSLGNVGQMAIDLIMNTANHETWAKLESTEKVETAAGDAVEKIGVLRSANVLPMAGTDPLDVAKDAKSGKLCSNLEVYRLESAKITFLQIRAPIVEGAALNFAHEIVRFSKDCGFSGLLVLAGSDSSANFEQEVMLHQFRFVATGAVAEEDTEVLQRIGMPQLQMQPGMVRLPVYKAGLLSPLFQACQDAEVPMRGLIIFCKEGFNVPEACMMGGALQAVTNLFQIPPKAWRPPACWQYLDGGAPDISLFQ